jgi:hypothetical protein
LHQAVAGILKKEFLLDGSSVAVILCQQGTNDCSAATTDEPSSRNSFFRIPATIFELVLFIYIKIPATTEPAALFVDITTTVSDPYCYLSLYKFLREQCNEIIRSSKLSTTICGTSP